MKPIVAIVIALLVAASCSSNTDTGEASGATEAAGTGELETGIRLVTAQQGAEIQADPPAGLIILDVRTPEEFADGHLEDAVMIDFYEPDFADRLAELDPDQPYLLYCRSGNRSGQTTAIMKELGFSDVADVDGGILAWSAADLPLEG